MISTLHPDRRAAGLLDLTLAFIELGGPKFLLQNTSAISPSPPSSSSSSSSSISSSCFKSSREAQQFWRRFDSIDTVFAIIKVIELLLTTDNLTSDRVTTQRDIYYAFVELLPRRDQAVVNRAIESVSRFVNAPRHELGIFASTRGFVTGCIALGAATLLSSGAGRSMAIPGEFVALPLDADDPHKPTIALGLPEEEHQRPRCILVVEKDSVFQALMAARIWQQYPLVMITGRGFPDVATRVLTSRLAMWLRVPVYGLVDYNPAGVRILFVYRFGGAKNDASSDPSPPCSDSSIPSSSNTTCPSLRWLGARAADLDLVRNNNHRAAFTKRDTALATGLIRDLRAKGQQHKKKSGNSDQLQRQSWNAEVEIMRESMVRFDLEAIADLPLLVLRKIVAGDAI